MDRLLFIVARDRSELYQYLVREFADEPEVQVILDRRVGDGRAHNLPCEPERRRGERRMNASFQADLRSLGYAIVPS